MVCFCFVNCVDIGFIYIKWYSRTKTTTRAIRKQHITETFGLTVPTTFHRWNMHEADKPVRCRHFLWIKRLFIFALKGLRTKSRGKYLFDWLVMQNSGLQIVHSGEFLITNSLMNSWFIPSLRYTALYRLYYRSCSILKNKFQRRILHLLVHMSPNISERP